MVFYPANSGRINPSHLPLRDTVLAGPGGIRKAEDDVTRWGLEPSGGGDYGGNLTTPSTSSPRNTKEGAMDYDNRAHRMTDDELEEWNRDPLGFVRGILIAAALCLVFWAAVVVVFVIF